MQYKRRPGIFIPFVILGVVALLGLIVMKLWNSILPGVTGIKAISYWQAIGLLILCKILFGSFRPGSPGFRGRGAWRHKLMNMSAEDKARFREEWRARRFGKQPPVDK